MMAGKVIMLADSKVGIVATYHIAPHSQLVTVASRVLSIIQKRSISRIDKIVSVSPVAQAFSRASTKRASLVIPNAIDCSLWKPKSGLRPEYDIVFVGRLVPRKGCIYLLKAIAQIIKQAPKTKLRVAIAGTGPDADMLTRFVKEHKLTNHVSFLGYITEEEKRVLLQSTRLAVFPSTGGESFGIVLLEAMAAGAVTLAGDNDGYRSVIGPAGGSLVHPQATNQFAQQISELLGDADKLTKLGKSQQKLISQYDIENVGDAILALYKDIISSKGTKNNVTGYKKY
jgi:phosphatidylinositol alpha-mannosyltransferase